MPKYYSKPRASSDDDWWYEPPASPDMVTVDDAVAVNTGLFDGNGHEIWRAPNPMGFGRDSEW